MKKLINATTVALALTFGVATAPAADAFIFPGFAAENLIAAEADIADQINDIRVAHGLAPLGWNQYLSDTSRGWSQTCAQRDVLAHDPVALQVSDLENVAEMYRNPRDAVNGWMNSPGHRANILSPYAKTMGIGVAKNNLTGGYFITMRGSY
ncbi:CAP domain-containing protein [Corynebacterium hindlerae]|uniref:CAP domain-containing protein n=1 Tax=Corynebacterium hindlerae TaxID=699041 RepID=UPI0031B7371E